MDHHHQFKYITIAESQQFNFINSIIKVVDLKQATEMIQVLL
jgi:hypothetical protein